MISIIYGGETHGICYELFSNIVDALYAKAEDVNVIDLSVLDINYSIPAGYQTNRESQWLDIQKQLKESDTLIFLYPLYWLNVPMRLKGFIDNVLWPNEAFSFKDNATYKKGYWKGKKAIIIYTLGGPEWFHKFYRSSGLMAIKYPMKFVGVMDVKHFYIDNVNSRKMSKDKLARQVTKVTKKVVGCI